MAHDKGKASEEERQAHFVQMRETRMAHARQRGIDEELVSEMVESFYAAIRNHDTLGPIFAGRVKDWPWHLANMKRFWASVLMGAGTYEGNPMQKHATISGIGEKEFGDWLALFAQTLDSLDLPHATREMILARAKSIASSLLNGVIMVRDGGLKV